MLLIARAICTCAGNKIQNLDKFRIVNVPNVRYLFLDRNQIRALIPDSLNQFKQLEIVDMSYNNIAEIPRHAFKGLKRLMQLNLEGKSSFCFNILIR